MIVNEPLPIVCPTVKLVTIPVLILASTASSAEASIVVIVAPVPTISVIIPDVILTVLRSAVSVSKVVIVATPATFY